MMTQPTTLTDSQRALAAAIGEAFALAIAGPFQTLAGLLRQSNAEQAELVAAIDRLTNIIAAQAIGDADPDDAPDIEMPIERFHSFDWGQIGAQILAEDEFGPAVVSYGGKAFKRRSPDNQFNPAIWFSRCIGKDEAGNNKYVRLITFKPMSDKVEPMGRKAEKASAGAPASAPQPAPGAGSARNGAPATATTQPVRAAAPASEPPEPRTGSAPSAGAQSQGQPAPAPAPEPPGWADQEFDDMPSASAGKTPLQPKPPAPTGPRVSQGAARDDNAAPAASAAPLTGRRQATIGGGDVYNAFTKWAVDFAARYPHYRATGSDRPNFYGIQCSIYARGAAQDGSRFSHVKDLPLLGEAIAAMEAHAAANHGPKKE